MKYFIIIILGICIIATSLFANEERIKNLILENTEIDQKIPQYQAEINRLTQLKLINIGRIEELKRIEAEKEQERIEAEKKAEETKEAQ